MSELRAEGQRLADTTFKIFAVIGFLSSIITIYVWFTSSAASLTTTTTQKQVEVPYALQLSQFKKESYDLEAAVSDLSQRYCNPVSVDFAGAKSRNFSYDQQKCDDQKALYGTLQKLVALEGQPLIAHEIRVANDGTAVADNFKIRSPINVQASAEDESGNSIRVTTLQDQRLFSIPSLNPRETTRVRLLSTTPIKGRYEEDNTAPTITFSGGKPSAQNNIYVSGRYSGIVKFLDDLPVILQIVFIVGGAFLITVLWLVPLGLISDRSTKNAAAKKALAGPDGS